MDHLALSRAGLYQTEMSTQMTYYVPDFDEIRAFERRAQEIRAAECARLARGAITWLRDLLHVGGHHHGHPAR